MKIKKILIWAAAIMGLILIGFFIMITTTDLSDYLVKLQDIVTTKTGRKLVFNGDARISLGLTTSIKLNDISFANAEGLKTPYMFTVQKIEADIDIKSLLKKKIVIKQLLLKKANILIEKDHNGNWNYLFANKKQDREVTDKNASNGNQKSQNKLPQDSDNIDQNLADIIINTLVIEDSQIQIREDQSEPAPPIKIDRFKATMNGSNNPIALDILARFDYLNMSLKGYIGGLSSLIETDQLTPFKFNCIINESDLNLDGTLTKAFQSDKPGIEVDIKSNKLNMVSLFNENPKKVAKKVQAKKDERIFSTVKINNSFLSLLDLKADIDVKTLILGTFFIENLKSKVVMEKGVLHFNPFSATLLEGNLNGDLKMSALNTGINIASEIKVNNLDIKNFIKQFDLKKDLQGEVDVNWQLEGQGQTLSNIMATLDGPVSITMKDGKIETNFIQSFGSDIFTNIFGFLNPFGEDIPYNTLNCAAARLEFDKGIGAIKVMLVDLPKMTAAGIGRVNLIDETLDIVVMPSPKKGIGTKGLGKINLSFSNLTKAFKVQGKMTHPEVNIDHSGTTKNIAKTIGGIALLGPVGIVASLIGTSNADQDPCPCALTIAQTGTDSSCKAGVDIKSTKDSDATEGSNPLQKILNIFN